MREISGEERGECDVWMSYHRIYVCWPLCCVVEAVKKSFSPLCNLNFSHQSHSEKEVHCVLEF